MIDFKITENNVREVLAEFQSKKNMALEAIGLQAEGYAQFYAPVDTGRLQNSISHGVLDKDSVAIGTNVEYAPYQEFGTSKMSPHPFIKPAVENFMDEYKNIAESIMKS